jgi:hypothetical protein
MSLSADQQFSVQMGLQALDSFSNAGFASAGAGTALLNADLAIDRGRFEEASVRRNMHRLAGTQVASLAANGVDVTQGSALDFIADQAFEMERQALGVRFAAEQQAASFQQQAADFQDQSDDLRDQGFLQTAFSIGNLFF